MAADDKQGSGDKRLLEEYFAIADDTAKLSDRRQTVANLFLGVNSLFLGGMGYVIVSSHWQTWLPAAMCVGITVVTFAVNLTWIHLIHRYRDLVNLRIRYLKALERRLQDAGIFDQIAIEVDAQSAKKRKAKGGDAVATGSVPALRGVYGVEGQSPLYSAGAKVGFFQLERRFIIIFMIAYFLVTAVVVALTALIMLGILPAKALTL